MLKVWDRDFPRSYKDPPTRTYPSGTNPAEPLRPDLIRTRFRPDSDLKTPFSGLNQVEIGSKSGPNQVWAEGFGWVGAGGAGPAGEAGAVCNGCIWNEGLASPFLAHSCSCQQLGTGVTGRPGYRTMATLHVLPFLAFLEFLAFFLCEEFLVFFERFPPFSRDFGGSVGIKNPCFFGGFPCLFFSKKKKNKERKDRE